MRLSLTRLMMSLLKFAVFAIVYAVAARLGREVDHVQENVRVLLPQSGVALAGLLILGLRYWPSIVIGSLLVTRFAAIPNTWPIEYSPTPVAWINTMAFAFSNTIGALAGAWALRHLGRIRLSFGRVHDVYNFLLAGIIIAPIIGATLAVGIFYFMESLPAKAAWDHWWRRCFGQGISNLIIAPVLMTWSGPSGTGWPMRRFLELALLTSALILVALNVFTGQFAIVNLNYPLSFAPFPFMVWAALRFGARGAVTLAFLIAVIAIFGTSSGFGPFSRRQGGEGLIILQVYLTAISVSSLFLAAAVAERREKEEELLASREELRALSARLQQSREEERAQASREIHDELGQQLTSLKIGIKALQDKLEKAPPQPDLPALAERAGRLWEIADESVQAVRRIASDLRPGMLDDLGLVASLQWLTRQFTERTGIQTKFTSESEERCQGTELDTAIFRIVQESLTNVAKHAQATHAEISLRLKDDKLLIEIRDNGKGLTEHLDEQSARRGAATLGLAGMRERAELLGGAFSIQPVEGKQSGTMVQVIIPCEPAVR